MSDTTKFPSKSHQYNPTLGGKTARRPTKDNKAVRNEPYPGNLRLNFLKINLRQNTVKSSRIPIYHFVHAVYNQPISHISLTVHHYGERIRISKVFISCLKISQQIKKHIRPPGATPT